MADMEIDAKRWREFCRLATFDRVGFNRPEEEGFTVRIKVPTAWDRSFTQAIDASIIARQRTTSEISAAEVYQWIKDNKPGPDQMGGDGWISGMHWVEAAVKALGAA